MADDASGLAGELRLALGSLVRRLREQGGEADITGNQKAVLLRLERDGPATASALARAEGMRPQSMATIIAALEGSRFVAGTPDPKDGRQTLVTMTEEARVWLSDARAARQDWLHRALQTRLTPEERLRLGDAVGLLKRLTDD